jgi:hypothetical protein
MAQAEKKGDALALSSVEVCVAPAMIQRRAQLIAPDWLLDAQTPFQIVNIQTAGLEGAVIENFLMQRNIRLDAFDHHFR